MVTIAHVNEQVDNLRTWLEELQVVNENLQRANAALRLQTTSL